MNSRKRVFIIGHALALMARVRGVLTPDLLKPLYQHLRAINMTSSDLAVRERARYLGHCYAASEALYHLLGGRDAGLTPCTIKHEGCTHWYLRTRAGSVLDATADQFIRPVDYTRGRGRGFLTREPSKRARIIMERLTHV